MTAVDAVLALLGTAQVTVHDGRVPLDPVTGKLPPRPYVVVYGPGDGDGTRRVDSLAGTSRWVDGVVQTTVVGDSALAVRIVSARVITALLDVTPAVAGRSCFPIRHDDSQTVRRDDDVQPPVLYGVLRWLLQSVPA